MERVPAEVVLGVVASAASFVVGFSMQDWGGPSGAPTGQNDATWGTWATSYALSVECVAFGLTALGGGAWSASARAGFLVEGLGWACAGLMRQHFAEPSPAYATLWKASLVTTIVGGFLQVGVVQVMARPDGASSSGGAGTIGCYLALGLVVAGIALAECGTNLVFGSTFLVLMKLFMMLIMLVSGCGACAYVEALAVAATFALAVGIKQLQPMPFSWSPDFDDNGLFHSAWMLYLSATLALMGQLSRVREGEDHGAEMDMVRRKADLGAAISGFDTLAETDEGGLLCCTACVRKGP